MLNLKISHNWQLYAPSSKSALVRVPRSPLPNKKYKIHPTVSAICEPGPRWNVHSGTDRSQLFAWKVNLGIFPGSPQDVNRGQIHLGVPGERRGGRLVEMAHQEDPDRANKEHRCHDNETDPVNHPGNQEPLFILLNEWESSGYVYLNSGWVNRKVDLTFWKLFCCLAVSAICLQETTHFFTSGEAFARLIPSCSGVPPSSPSSVCKYSCIHSCTRSLFSDGIVLKHSRSFSSTDFISPFLSLSLENMSSDRAVFIAYSSALVMSVMELRRRQGTRNIPFPSVAKVSRFWISDVLSLFGVQGRILIFSKRGRIFKRTWRLTQGQRLNPWQTDPCWLSGSRILHLFCVWLVCILTFRTVSVIMWVLGVLRDTLSTITQFITTIVVTDITNIKYLQCKR